MTSSRRRKRLVYKPEIADEIQETLLQFAAIVNRRNEGLEHLTAWNRKLETWRESSQAPDGQGSISRNGLTP